MRANAVTTRRPGRRLGALLALSALTLVVGGAPASADSPSYRDEVLADTPVGYWRFGEASGTRAADQTANATPGTYQNGVILRVPGALGTSTDTAASFDGGNDQVTMGDPANGVLDVGTGDFSVETWVKTPGAIGTERGLIGKRDANKYWIVNVTDDSGHVGQLRAIVFDGTVTRSVYSLHRVDDGRWHHVVVAFDRDSGIRFYVDGVNSGFTVAPMTGNLDNTGVLLVGKTSGYPQFKGEFDEVALYPALLSQQRVQAHHYASLVDTTAPTVSLAAPAVGLVDERLDADILGNRRHGERRLGLRHGVDSRRLRRVRARRRHGVDDAGRGRHLVRRRIFIAPGRDLHRSGEAGRCQRKQRHERGEHVHGGRRSAASARRRRRHPRRRSSWAQETSRRAEPVDGTRPRPH